MAEDIAQLGLAVSSDQVVEADRRLEHLEKQSGKTERATDTLKASANRAAVTFGALAAAAAAAAAAYAIVKTKEFNKSISDLSAITGATGKDLDFLKRKALEFGAATTMSASQAAEAFKLVASAKPDLLENADALAAVTRETITLAEAAGLDLPQAAAALGASLNQFSADADESTRFINVLAAGAKFGASEIEATAQALKMAGTVASGAGLSFEETNAAIQTLASVAIKGSEAGTGLRGVLLKLSTQSRDEFNPEIVGFTAAMKNLSKATLTTTEKKKLFGQESITSANALIKQAGSLDTLIGKLTNTNTAYDQARTRVNNLDGDMKQLNSAIEAQAIMFGDKLDPSLRILIQGFTDVIRVEKQTAEETDKAKQNALELALAVGQVADVLGNAANGIAFPFEAVGGAIGALAGQIVAITQGEFKQAMLIGQAYADDMHQKLIDMTDPEISTRYEDIARRMIEANKKVTDSSKDLPPSGQGDSGTASGGTASVDLASKAAEDAFNMLQEMNQIKLGTMKDYYTELMDLAHQASTDQETLAIEAFDTELNRIEEQRQWRLDNMVTTGETEAEIQAEIDAAMQDSETIHLEKINAIRKNAYEKDIKAKSDWQKFMAAIDKGAYGDSLKLAGKFADTIVAIGGKSFEDNKNVQMAIAGIKGLGTIMNAVEHGSRSGGIYGAIAEGAIATAMVAGQIMKIKNASMGGSGGVSGPSGASVSTSTSYNTGNVPAAPEAAKESLPPQVTIIQTGNGTEFIDNMVIPQINDRSLNSDVQIIDIRSRNAQEIIGALK